MPCSSTPVSISLPVLKSESPPRIKKSKNARRRWIVLAVIQGLMIVHVIQWLITGSTTTPIEPSESMEAVKNGVINVGTIFFALALLSTAIFGRWVCGWACHVVLLQDFCAAMLAKVGIRPRPFRARLLMFMPLALAFYMFLWPVVYRLAIAPLLQPELKWPGWSLHLTTDQFWATFPGVLVAIPFLFVCGFVTVYFLGAKGFCTYGCPYGGFFAPLDELAPVRIRVTDACEGCGHCTAVCTSNVRVHEEVRDYGMVVDPGCMKCMDCVSVCPKEALYVGFGAPAISKKPRVEPEKVARRAFDLSMPEEIAFAAFALFTFLAVRGIYGVIPLLMAAGVTICVVWIVWKAYRTLRDTNAQLHGIRLRYHGVLRPAGVGLLAAAALLVALLGHSAVVSGAFQLAGWHDDRVFIRPEVVFSENPMLLEPSEARHAEQADSLYRLASFAGDGGIGLGWGWQPAIDLRRAWLAATQQRHADGEALMRRSLDRYGVDEARLIQLTRLLRAQGRPDEAVALATESFESSPTFVNLIDEIASMLASEGENEASVALVRASLARVVDDRSAGHADRRLLLMRRLSLLLILHGEGADLSEGIELVRETLRLAPNNPFAHYALALGLGKSGDLEAAEVELRRAVELAPDDPRMNQALGELLSGTGRGDEARPYLSKGLNAGGGQ